MKHLRIAFFQSGDPLFKGRKFIAEHYYWHGVDELKRRGHEIKIINPPAILGQYGSAGQYSEITVKTLQKFYSEGGCDLFFSNAIDHQLLPEAVSEISRIGIPTVSFNWDDYDLPYRVKKLTPAFDLVWTTVRENMHIIRGYGAKKLIHQPFAANPFFFKPVKTEENKSVYFIGSCYGARFRSVCILGQAGIPVKAFGLSPFEIYGEKNHSNPLFKALNNWHDGWERLLKSIHFKSGRECIIAALYRSMESLFCNTPEKNTWHDHVEFLPGPTFEEMPSLFSAGALSLGSLELASTFVLKKPLLFIRLREFEATMSGAVHLANDYSPLRQYFQDEKEMLFYHDADDLVDKARFYLNPAQKNIRTTIRANARKRSLGEHTWSHRYQKLFDELGIPAKV